MFELIEVRREGHACVVQFRREQKLNAISAQLERELCGAIVSPEARDASCVIFTGGERVFSAGADLNEMSGLDPAAIVSYYEGSGDYAERVADLPQPTFCAIAGYCLGGGLELALATDFRIADRTAVFGLPEVGLGILPSSGGTHRLVQLFGAARAKELILLHDRLRAEDALRLGLISELVDEGQALERALAHAERLAALPQLAVKVTKRVINSMADGSRASGVELERLAYGLLAQTPEADEENARRVRRR
ncbi:MAG TPA: enoyl-CoA hydratase/isomerase family protein [Solirubrobacteraceae bacterium]|nr:enoyl-CoA hydratase/isomerase family protein [Solirubrobacteraceae bacterium]